MIVFILDLFWCLIRVFEIGSKFNALWSLVMGVRFSFEGFKLPFVHGNHLPLFLIQQSDL